MVNSCTVKNPSQAAMGSLLARGRALGKGLVVTGCVPQGSRSAPELAGLSLLGALHTGIQAGPDVLQAEIQAVC